MWVAFQPIRERATRQELETRDIQIMSYEEAVSALRRQLSNISDSIVEKDKLIVQLNEAYRHEEKVAIYAIYASSTIVLWRSC